MGTTSSGTPAVVNTKDDPVGLPSWYAANTLQTGFSSSSGNMNAIHLTSVPPNIRGPVRVGIFAAHPSSTGRNGTHQLTYAIANVQGRIAYPTVVYIDSDLNVLAPVQGYLTPDQMEPILRQTGAKRFGVRMKIDKVVSWDHSKLGGTY